MAKNVAYYKKSLIERYLKERNISLHLRGRFKFWNRKGILILLD